MDRAAAAPDRLRGESAAAAGFVIGRETRDWAAFLDKFSDDVTFFLSSPRPFQGENHGKHRVEEFAQYALRREEGRLKFEEPVCTAHEGATVVFKAWDDGSTTDQGTANRVALSFNIANGKVTVPAVAIGGAKVGETARLVAAHVETELPSDCGHFLPEECPGAVVDAVLGMAAKIRA